MTKEQILNKVAYIRQGVQDAIGRSNEVTGGDEQFLYEAVEALAAGYGGGERYVFSYDNLVDGYVASGSKALVGNIPGYNITDRYIAYVKFNGNTSGATASLQIMDYAVMLKLKVTGVKEMGCATRYNGSTRYANVLNSTGNIMFDDAGNVYLYSYIGTNGRLAIGNYTFTIFKI